MNDDWAERLRKHLENYEVEPPPELWESICERLGIDPEPAPEPVPAKKPAQIKRWIWAAAAGILALVGVFVAYQWGDDEVVAEAEKVSNEVIKEPVLSKIQEESVVEEKPSYQLMAVKTQKRNQGNRPLIHANSSLIQALPQHQTTCPPDSAEAETSQSDRNLEENSRDSVRQNHDAVPMITELYPEPTPVPAKKQASDAGKWTIGLNASGGLLASNNSVYTDRLYHQTDKIGMLDEAQSIANDDYYYYPTAQINYNHPYYNYESSYTITEHLSKHRLPIRFGLSLHYQFHPRLAFMSGISYTRLYSEFSFPLYGNISYSQRLHYIGVPFGVAWQLWTANRFSVYLAGGAMVEKCVSVSIDGDYTGQKPWQWSVSGAIGAEYAFTSLLGAYIEPSLGYYFSDGTQLEHYYKEHPLAPSIEFGLRMHFGR